MKTVTNSTQPQKGRVIMKESNEELIDIGDIVEGVWFPFQTSQIDPDTGKITWDDPVLKSNGDPKASMCIRLTGPFYEERIAKRDRITKYVFNTKSRAMEPVTSFKELSMEEIKAEREDAIDYSIVNFNGFGKSGKPLDVTRENKLLLIRQPAIDRFFAYCQERLSNLGVERKKAEAENFTSGSSGQTNTNPE